VEPRWAQALVAARAVHALIGTGHWYQLALVYVCSHNKASTEIEKFGKRM